MKNLSRLDFLRLSLGVSGLAACPTGTGAAGLVEQNTLAAGPGIISTPKSEVGIYMGIAREGIDHTFRQMSKMGFSKCELYTGSYGPEMIRPLNDAIAKYKIELLALFTLGPGPTTWDFYEGQQNIGLVSRQYRAARVQALKQLSDLAKACGVGMIETHVGYIPENPLDPNYRETVNAIKEIVSYCKKNNQEFLYHAGQESPTTLLRTMTDVGLDNQGVGMDTANLIMYDRGHPYHSLDVYGKHIRLVNAKDGLYPVNAKELGKEVQIGHGKVEFPSLIKKLKLIGYKGPIIIEREGSEGIEWENDVTQSREFLQILIDRPA